METEFFSDYENEKEYDSHYENDYDDTDYYEDSFYALTDGMCGDYDDGVDLDSVMTYLGLDWHLGLLYKSGRVIYRGGLFLKEGLEEVGIRLDIIEERWQRKKEKNWHL